MTESHFCHDHVHAGGTTGRTAPLFALAGAAVLPLTALVFAAAGGPFVHGPVLCTARRLFGVPCPFCGMTTSFTFFARASFADAFKAAPLGPVLFVGLTGLAVWCLLLAVRRRPFPSMSAPVWLRRWYLWAPLLLFGMWLYQYYRVDVWRLYV